MTEVIVKVSAKSARLPFVRCGPDCIALGCRAQCCDAPTRPGGCLVSILPSEAAALTTRGATVVDGLLRPAAGKIGCPFKRRDHLCALHDAQAKPFGCIASPFYLNQTRTLVIRNRYKLLPCGRFGRAGLGDYAFRVFASSLDLIFGTQESTRVKKHLEAGGGDLRARMTLRTYQDMVALDEVKHAAA